MIQFSTIKDWLGRVDWLLVLAALGLVTLGVIYIASARSPAEAADDFPLHRQFFFKQAVFVFMGLSAAVVFNFLDYHSWARWSLVFYWACIGILLLVPFIGITAGGARRWINLGLFNFQPSELTKLAFIFMLASFLSRPDQELRVVGNFWKAIGMMVLPFIIILKEPDLGSALIFIPVGLVTMFVGGIPVKWLAQLGAAGFLVIALVLVDVFFAPKQLRFVELEEYQKRRLMVYFGMDFAPKNATEVELRAARQAQLDNSHQSRQALISVGSGGMWGKGWRKGPQTLYGYLPPGAAHNDFIFSVIAHERGFIGSAAVILLYAVVLLKGIWIASRARDRLGKLLAVGVVALLFSHVFINIGMNIRLMPVTGVPLPLLSYGGTSVIVSLIAIGILHNVHLYRRAY